MLDHNRDKQVAIEWAQNIIANPDKYVLLDTETTGFGDAEIVQIGILGADESILVDSLICPTIPIPSRSTEIHGITDEMVRQSPSFPDLYPAIIGALQDKIPLIYNARFDCGILDYCCKLHNLESIYALRSADCVMMQYSAFVGDLGRWGNSYKWQKLAGGDHTAIGDCWATLAVINGMATSVSLAEIDRMPIVWSEFFDNYY